MSGMFRFFLLIDMQAKMALRSEAAKTYLSYLWWVIEPVTFVLIFYLVFEVFLSRGGDNFLFFLMCGKIPYLWFSKSVANGSESIVGGIGIIGQVDIPKVVFPYASIQESLYKQFVVFIVLFLVAIIYGAFPTSNWLWILPIWVVNYLLIVAVVLIGALFVCYVPDFRHLISMGLMMLLFISGIFWDINQIQDEHIRNIIFLYNPLAFLIDAYRQVLVYQQAPSALHLMMLSAVLIAIIFLMHWVYKVNSRSIAARVLNR